MKRKLQYWSFALQILILLASCRRHIVDDKTPVAAVDISIERFESDLFSADPARIDSLIPCLEQRYGTFFTLFTRQITSIGNSNSPGFQNSLQSFITDYYNYAAYKRVQEVFPRLDKLNESLTGAFHRYRYYYPEKPLPRIITFVSGFNYSVVSDSNLLAIGLDKYLGTDEELYARAGIYNYLRMNMRADKIPSDCMRLWAETEFEYNDSVNNLLTNIIYEGKIMYWVKKMLPGEPDSLIWGFTGPRMNFCLANEKQMWTYLVEYKLLFKSDRFTLDKYTREGPFTKDFSDKSPARAAVWIGYRIVEKYMKKEKNSSLKTLMSENDYQKILSTSGYNP
jgi:hypothetical protein